MINPQPASFYNADFLSDPDKYSSGIYLKRNKIIARFVQHFKPQHIVEVAGGEGNLATQILARHQPLSYAWSDFSPVAVQRVRELLKPSVNLTVEEIDLDKSFPNVKQCDCFISTALEHIEKDREQIAQLPSGCLIILGLPNFPSRGHLRYFPNFESIYHRYSDLARLGRYYVSVEVWRSVRAELFYMVMSVLEVTRLIGLIRWVCGYCGLFMHPHTTRERLHIIVMHRI